MPRHRVPRSNRHLRTAPDQPGTQRTDSAETLERRTQSGGSEDHGYDAPGRFAEGRRRDHRTGGDFKGLFGRFAGMSAFRYQAIEANGGPARGVIEADDRKTALQLLGKRGLFPSSLEVCSPPGEATTPALGIQDAASTKIRFGARVRRREITSFTREL